jgi:hypothetical protein
MPILRFFGTQGAPREAYTHRRRAVMTSKGRSGSTLERYKALLAQQEDD